MAKLNRKEKAEELFKHHEDYFEVLGLEKNKDFVYIPKLFHYRKGRATEGKVAGFFDSEFRHKLTIYTEKVDMNWDSEDPERILYKFKFNPYYEEEFEQENSRYLVPESEFEIVDKSDLIQQTSDSVIDMPMSEMTMRDYVAIHTGNPVSTKKWLNQLIQK